MADTVNEDLVDAFIRHQVYLERLKTGQLGQLQRFLQQLMDDVSAQLGKRLTDITGPGGANVKRLQDLLKDLQAVSDDVAQQMREAVVLQMKDLAAYESGWTLTTLQTTIPVTVSFTTVSPTQLWAAVNARPFEGRLMNEWFRDYSQAQRTRISQQVRMGVVEGQTVDQVIRRVRGTKALNYRDGVVQGITRRSAEALVRTATGHVVQMARQATFDANTDVIKGLSWHAVLDSRTSEICQARDGKVYDVDKGPRPPAHPNCRSTMVPVVKSWQEMGINLAEAPEGTRASMDGQVPRSTTYETWLKKQPANFQDDVLGRTKGQLFRKGGLTLDRFVDEKAGRAYTLEELRQKHPAAFRRANV